MVLLTDCSTSFLQADKEKITMEGTSIAVTCLYDAKYRWYKKYWCQGSSRTYCDILGDTDNVKGNYKGRLLLRDNKRGVFTVIMQQLAEADSGTYWCGIDRPYADIMIQVKLVVKKDPERWGSVRTTSSSTPSSTFSTTTPSTVEMATAFPGNSKLHLNVSFPSNSSGHLGVTKGFRNWNCSPWGILRWMILLILLAALMVIHWNRVHYNW
uniref:CMRF35-like molecule 5 n=1 Tax=Euleptes europaea TaxID=460621 RepID=UPI00254162BD|nr:CMRF35-like molecule 5 [Euleptes europaea]